MILEILFWILLFFIFYTYIGYPILLTTFVFIKRLFSTSQKKHTLENYPEITLFVAAYNEKDYVDEKIKNALELDYPKEKIHHLWVTDGSNDGTPEYLKKYNFVKVLHKDQRNGKIAAMNRGMKYVETPIVIFSDGNTLLSKDSIKKIVEKFENPIVGCVAGEKKISEKNKDDAASSGEGMYWKYESYIKKMDSELNSSIGAAGELFAIRTQLFEEVEGDTLVDDFIISLRIAMKGYKVKYAPGAYAIETASANVKEEMKRKIRIAAGGIQSIFRLKKLLNPFFKPVLTFQYISHKVFRWTINPISMLLLIPINILLAIKYELFSLNIYSIFLCLQTALYLIGFVGFIFEHKKIRFKIIFIPYYLIMTNISQIRGIFRYFAGKQSVNWERAKRGK